METKDHFYGRLNGHRFERTAKTENYVRVPPALLITDERGDVWSLGHEYAQHGWRLFFNVVRNDVNTGEMAEVIEFVKGRIKIYTPSGVKFWNGKSF